MENPGPKKFKMTYTEAVRRFCDRAFDFRGRATRAEFCYGTLLCFMLSIIALSFVFIPVVPLLFVFVIFVPGLALLTRRYHDIGYTGWRTLLIVTCVCVGCFGAVNASFASSLFFAVLMAFALAALVPAFFFDSQKGKNKYGDSEKYPSETD